MKFTLIVAALVAQVHCSPTQHTEVTPIAIEDVKDVFAQVVLPRLLMDGAPPIDGDSFNAELENASVKSKNVLGEIIALCRKNFSRDVLLKAYFVYLAFATTAALALYIRYSSDSVDYNWQNDQTSAIHARSTPLKDRPDVLKALAEPACAASHEKAIFLSLWFGILGVDQFVAQHYILGIFKLLAAGGLGFWACIDMNLWLAGYVYSTPACEKVFLYNGKWTA